MNPHSYQKSIYERIKRNWANDSMVYGNIVYLETGTGKTYVAIMLIKYLFSSKFIDYQTRLAKAKEEAKLANTELEEPLEPIQLEPETEDELKLVPQSDEAQRWKKEERVIKLRKMQEEGTLESEIKK